METCDARSKKLLGHIASGIPRTSSWKDDLHVKSFPPPRIRQALVPAASRLASPDDFANPKQLLRSDGTPVIPHLLNKTEEITRAFCVLLKNCLTAPELRDRRPFRPPTGKRTGVTRVECLAGEKGRL